MEDDLEGKQDDEDAELLVPCGQQREHNCRERLCDLLFIEILGRRLQICLEKS
jgi:hypothetical protein